MKKFISMVMAAAMVVSLVPATAFAAKGEVVADTIKVIGADEYKEDFTTEGKVVGHIARDYAAEVQIVVDEVSLKETTGTKEMEQDITISVEGAEFKNNKSGKDITEEALLKNLAINGNAAVQSAEDPAKGTIGKNRVINVEIADFDDTSVTFTLSGTGTNVLKAGDVISFDLVVTMDDTDVNSVATVSVESDIVGAELTDAVFAEVVDTGIKATLKDTADVAVEETTGLEKDLKIETVIGAFVNGQKIEMELSNGFEWVKGELDNDANGDYTITIDPDDDSVAVITIAKDNLTKITVAKDSVKIDAVEAEVGDICKIKIEADDNVKGAFEGEAEVEAVVVVAEGVTMTLDDEDEDLPVIYSGVSVKNVGITDDSDHKSLKVHFEESVAAALDEKKAFNLTLTEGVLVTNVEVTGAKNVNLAVDGSLEDAFKAAYKKGDQETFEFARKTFADSVNPFEFDVTFTLVALPGFEGDVTLTLDGAAFEEAQEVTIATFVAPYTVEAQANDVIIDYRNTEIPTDIVITEAEAGLWDESVAKLDGKGLKFEFAIEKFDSDDFEGDAVYTVNKESEMEIKTDDDVLGFVVDEESDDEAAVVTISNISLYMSRALAAGAYDLKMGTNAASYMVANQKLFTTEKGEDGTNYYVADFIGWDHIGTAAGNVNGWETEMATVKEGFVNVITAGRDQDDASFTKKVVVYVGETKMIAGEEEIALDVPAYISAAGYTMLPVRAVAVALGIHTNNVLWDQATKTVTILYGQRIITMTVGSKAINVNGSAIPASASPEVVDGRTFLPMRDLATALGVTDITWDAATKTATLNGNK